MIQINATTRLQAARVSDSSAVRYIKQVAGIDIDVSKKVVDQAGHVTYFITPADFKEAVQNLKRTIGKPRVKRGSYSFQVDDHKSIDLVPPGKLIQHSISLLDLAAS